MALYVIFGVFFALHMVCLIGWEISNERDTAARETNNAETQRYAMRTLADRRVR